MRRALLAALLPGCGAAAPPDAFVAPDAAVCSVTTPLDVPSLSNVEPEIVFDAELVNAPVAGAGAVFADDAGLIVFAAGQVHRVSLDGDSVVTTPSTLGDGLGAVVQGAGHFGAIVAGTGFCVVDASGAIEPGRCAPLPAGDVRALTFDGASYRVFLERSSLVRRLVYDPDAALLAEQALPGIGAVFGASSEGGRDRLYSNDLPEGRACRSVREHTITTTSDVVRDLLAGDATVIDDGVVAGSGPTGSSVVVLAACRDGDACRAVPQRRALLSTYVGDARVADAVPVPFGGWPLVVLRDGDRTVVLESRVQCVGSPDAICDTVVGVLWRLAPDGSVELQRRVTPSVAGDLALAGAVIGPGDYAIAYVNLTQLHELRLRRVRIP